MSSAHLDEQGVARAEEDGHVDGFFEGIEESACGFGEGVSSTLRSIEAGVVTRSQDVDFCKQKSGAKNSGRRKQLTPTEKPVESLDKGGLHALLHDSITRVVTKSDHSTNPPCKVTRRVSMIP